jgi:hypothetical protein
MWIENIDWEALEMSTGLRSENNIEMDLTE